MLPVTEGGDQSRPDRAAFAPETPSGRAAVFIVVAVVVAVVVVQVGVHVDVVAA